MIMYGKTLGNGYAITAVVGKEDVMEAAQKTFRRMDRKNILKTLELMNKIRSWEIITNQGEKMRSGWQSLFEVQH